MLQEIRQLWSFVGAILRRMDQIHMGLISAGVAFYAMLAVFPGLAATITLWSMWADPRVILTYVSIAEEFIPPQAAQILQSQVNSLLSGARAPLGWASVVSIGFAIFSARAGVNGLIGGLNAAYGVRSHSTIMGFLLAYLLTLVIVGVVLAGLATIVIVPFVINFLTVGQVRSWLVTGLPWAAMFILVMVVIGILYRYGPNKQEHRTPLFTWGSLFAALAWGTASIGFSAYLASFNSYNRIYGSIGAVIALLMWFYLAGFSVLLGALINVETSHRRRIRAARAAGVILRDRK